jgi:hypothetical protein
MEGIDRGLTTNAPVTFSRGKVREDLRIISVTPEIRTRYFPDTNEKRYR